MFSMILSVLESAKQPMREYAVSGVGDAGEALGVGVGAASGEEPGVGAGAASGAGVVGGAGGDGTGATFPVLS